MTTQALFSGLIIDEQDNLVGTGYIGSEAQYIIDDDGFHRHIPAKQIDQHILTMFIEQLKNNKDMAVQQALKMMGKDDLFTKAALDASISNVDMEQIMKQGLPQQARDMMGMMGFRIIVNYRGEIVNINQPYITDED